MGNNSTINREGVYQQNTGTVKTTSAKNKDYEYIITLENKRKFGVTRNNLGEGATAVVRLAREGKKLYAVKIMERSILEKMDIDYEKEMDIMKGLMSPYIVKIEGVAVNQNKIFLIMEYCDGGNLYTHYQNKKNLALKDYLKIMKDISSAMKELFDKKIIHRDIKPENILVHQGQVKLTDFGFARFVDSTTDAVKLSHKGTPLYAAPQILTCQAEYKMNCDVWSLGILFYGILYGGEHPLLGKNFQISQGGYIKLIKEKTLYSNFEILKEYPYRPKSLKLLIQDMIRYEESKRCSMPDVCDRLEEIIKEMDTRPLEIQLDLKQSHNIDFLSKIPNYTSQIINNNSFIDKINEREFGGNIQDIDDSEGNPSNNMDVWEIKKKIDNNNKVVIFIKNYLERKKDFGLYYLECVFMLTSLFQYSFIEIEVITNLTLTSLLLQKCSSFFNAFLNELTGPEGMKFIRQHIDEKILNELPEFKEIIEFLKLEIKSIQEWIGTIKLEINTYLSKYKIDQEKASFSIQCSEKALEDKYIEEGLEAVIFWLVSGMNKEVEDIKVEGKKFFNCLINIPGLQAKNPFPKDVNLDLIPNIWVLRELFEFEGTEEIEKRMKTIKKAWKNKATPVFM